VKQVLYQVYKWLVFVPGLFLSTGFCAAMAILLAIVAGPRVGGLAGVWWARFNSFLTPMRVRVTGRENLDPDQSYVIVANHQSHYDVFVLYGWLGVDFKWVMKQELRSVPALGYSCAKLGHIYIDRSDRTAALASIEAAKSRIVDGTSVLFFPEGTRSRDGRLRGFKKGAFRMALDLGLPILPMTIHGTRAVLPVNTFQIQPGDADLVIHPAVAVDGLTEAELPELIAKVRDAVASGLADELGR